MYLGLKMSPFFEGGAKSGVAPVAPMASALTTYTRLDSN